MKESRLNLKKRLRDTEDIPEKDQNRYYSAWFYSAIHIILSIPGYQDATKIAVHFNLPLELTISVINFLENCGLVESQNGAYVFTKKRIHLARESEFIQRHHINWRSQSLQSVEKNLTDDLHYSNVIAVSKNDYLKIKDIIVQAIEQARLVAVPSKEEVLCAMAVDIFKS